MKGLKKISPSFIYRPCQTVNDINYLFNLSLNAFDISK